MTQPELGIDLARPDWVGDIFIPGIHQAVTTDEKFQEAVLRAYDEAMQLLLKKHKDYGPKNISGAPGGALNGLLVRMTDKMARLEHLHYNKQDPENESLRETFMDLANYGLIAVLVLDGEWPQ